MLNKTKIRVITLGAIPLDLEMSKVESCQSSLFEIIGGIDTFDITSGADGENWEFSDHNILNNLPDNDGEDFLVAITNVPLELQWYTRRVRGNVVVLSLHEISDYLRFSNIPISNVVLRLLYAYNFVYLECNRIPPCDEYSNFTHDDTRGCLYDMNGSNKFDIIQSCVNPIICMPCVQRLASAGIATSDIEKAQKEIKTIKKDLFYRASEWISKHPLLSVLLASTWAFLTGLLVEYVANLLWPNA